MLEYILVEKLAYKLPGRYELKFRISKLFKNLTQYSNETYLLTCNNNIL